MSQDATVHPLKPERGAAACFARNQPFNAAEATKTIYLSKVDKFLVARALALEPPGSHEAARSRYALLKSFGGVAWYDDLAADFKKETYEDVETIVISKDQAKALLPIIQNLSGKEAGFSAFRMVDLWDHLNALVSAG